MRKIIYVAMACFVFWGCKSGSEDGSPESGAIKPAPGTGTPTHIDISAGQGTYSGVSPSAVIDTTNSKLLVAATNNANSGKLSLFRCNLDGTDCTHTDISAGQGTYSGGSPSAVIDTINSKLLVATYNGANSYKLSLFRCNLDGTACAHTDISAGQGTQSGSAPSAVIDTANAKLLVATGNSANDGKPSLFRCNLDGTDCTHTDISAGQGANSGSHPSTVIDTVNAKLLVVTENDSNSQRPSLFRCNLDGTSCTHTDISGWMPNSGFSPATIVDTVSAKLLVVTQNWFANDTPFLFRCNLDGTGGCVWADLSANQGTGSGFSPSVAIDTVNRKLLVVTINGTNSQKPSLFRCNLDGTNCMHTDISAGQAALSAYGTPSPVIDTVNGKLLVVMTNQANNFKLSLFRN